MAETIKREGAWIERPFPELLRAFAYYLEMGFAIYPRMFCRTCGEVRTMTEPQESLPLFAPCPVCGESHGFVFHGGNMQIRKTYDSEADMDSEITRFCEENNANPADWK